MAEIDRLDIVIATSVKDAKAQITQLQSELKAMKKTMATLTNTNPFKTTGKSASSASNTVRQQSRQMVKEYKKAITTMDTIRDNMAKKTFTIPDTAMGAKQALEKYQKMYATAREKVMSAQAHGEKGGKVYRNRVEDMYRAAEGIKAARGVLKEKAAKDEAFNSVRQQSQRMVKEYSKAAKTMDVIRDKMVTKAFSIPDTKTGATKALEDYKKMYATARDKVLSAQAHGENYGKVYRNQVENMYKAAQGIKAARQVLNEKAAKDEAYERLLEEERAAREAARSVEQLADAYDDVAKSSAKSSTNAKYVNRSLVANFKKAYDQGQARIGASPYIKSGGLNFEKESTSYKSLRDTISSMTDSIRSKAQEMRSAVGVAFDNMKTKVDKFKLSMREKAVANGILSYTQDFVTLQKSIDKTRADYARLTQAMQEYRAAGGSENDTTYRRYQARADRMRGDLDESMRAAKGMKMDGSAYQVNTKSLEANLKSLYSSFKKLESVADRTGKAIGRFISKVTGIGSASKSAKKGMNTITDIAKRLSKELTRVGRMAKLMVTRMAIRAVLNNVGEGFQSLAIHSAKFNESMSDLVNSSKTLGYSVSAMVSPLINALAPALKSIIELITRAVNALNQLFSALAGFGTWNKAKKFTDSWADSLKNANGAAKELKKTVLGFDELNQLQDSSSSGGAGGIKDMFEDVNVAPWASELAKNIKDIAKTLFDPIKRAWENVGEFVKTSWKYAMDEVLKLAKRVGQDFLKVWQQEKTQKIFENILETIGWIGVAVGNLAKQFRIAWESNDTGIKILEAIRDIILIITGHIRDMAQATAEWAAKLNFEPLLTSVQRWLESLKPVFDNIVGVIADFYNEVVLKFTQWVIESGLPKLIDVFREFNEKVDWEGLREKLRKLWEHLEPFMETVGEGLVIFIGRVTQKLADFVNSEKFENFLDHLEKWMDSVTPEDVADKIGQLATALIVLKGAAIAVSAVTGAATVINGIVAACKAGAAIVAGISSFALTLFMVAGAISEFASKGELVKDLALDFAAAVKGTDEAKTQVQNLKKEYDGFIGTLELLGNVLKVSWYAITGQWDKYEELSKKTKVLKDEHTGATKVVDIFGREVEAVTYKIGDMSKTTDESTRNVDIHVGAVAKAKGSEESFGKTIDDTKQSFSVFKDETGKVTIALQDNKPAFEKAGDAAKDANKKVADYVGTSKDNIKIVSDSTLVLKDNKPAFEKAGDAAKDANKKVSDYIGTTKDSIKIIPENTKLLDKDKTAYEKDGDAAKGASSKLGDFKTATEEATRIIPNMTKESEGVRTEMGNLTSSVEDTAKTVQSSFSEEKWTFSGVAEGLKKTFENAKSSIKNVWNDIADKLNGEHDIGDSKIRINLPKFAAGGFPDENGLFMANSSEMVGRFTNGRTAVANNAMIVDGIQAGVYNAVTSALANSNGSSQYISNEIVVDGEVIARSITKAQDKINRRYSPQTV